MLQEYSLEDIFTNIVQRVPNSVLQKTYAANGLMAGQNVEKTLEKTHCFITANKPEQIASLKAISTWYFNDYLLHGEKALYFYQIEEEEAKILINFLREMEIPASFAKEFFPLNIPATTLPNIIGERHLADIRPYHSGIALIISTVRKYTNRFKLAKKYLTKEALSKYPDANEIEAIENKYRQFFDIITLLPTGEVEIRIDNPKLDQSKQLPVKDRAIAFVETIHFFEEIATQRLGYNWSLPVPFDLLDTIDNLFTRKKEGNVRLINFTTSNSNAKESRAGRNKDHCCREDAFIKAGIREVELISPYRIKLNWKREENHYVELAIMGTIYNLDGKKSPLNEAIISRTRTEADYMFVRDTLMRYYRNETKDQYSS